MTPYTNPPKSFHSPSIEAFSKISGYKGKIAEDGLGALHLIAERVMGETAEVEGRRGTMLRRLMSALDIEALSGSTAVEKAVSAAHMLNAVKGTAGGEDEADNQRFEPDMELKDKVKALSKLQQEAREMRKKGINRPEEKLKENGLELVLIKEADIILSGLDTISFEDGESPVYDVMSSSIRTVRLGFRQLSKLRPHEIVPQNYGKLALNVFRADRPARARKETRDILVLYDVSGSMENKKKRAYLKAALRKFKESLIKRDVRLFLIPFEEKCLEKPKICTKYSQLVEFLNELPPFCMGITDVQNSLKHALSMYNRAMNKRGHPPRKVEVLVVNDGADKITGNYTPDAPVHVLILGEENEKLEKLCLKTGGTFNILRM